MPLFASVKNLKYIRTQLYRLYLDGLPESGMESIHRMSRTYHEYVARATHNQVFVHMQELAKTLLVKTRESSLSVEGSPEEAASAMHKHISEAMINVQKYEGL